MKRTLTPEQEQARAERKARFRKLVKQFADMPETERISLAAKHGLRTCDGHELSLCNTILIIMQSGGTASMVGGFRQWLAHGRAVQKGQHGMMIWVPCKHKAAEETPADGADAEDSKPGFIVGTVFDVSQTMEIETAQAVAA